MNEQTITEAYQKLAKARTDWWRATEEVTLRRAEVLRRRSDKLLNGELSGKNEAEREAQARAQLPHEYELLEIAELEEGKAKLNHDLCRLEVERIQTLLRFRALPGTVETGT
jgi:hypothetical protein